MVNKRFKNKAMLIKDILNLTYPRIHEDEIHLHKSENHLQYWIDAFQDKIAWRSQGQLEKGPKLQAIVDHGTETKC